MNCSSVSDECRSRAGRVFHQVGPDEQNARGPISLTSPQKCQIKISSTFFLRFSAERIDYKLHGSPCLQVSARCSTADLADELCQPADIEARCRLRSASASSLIVRRTRLSTVGDRAFPAPRIWNSLPQHVTSAPSLAIFRSHLKTHLFRRCFP